MQLLWRLCNRREQSWPLSRDMGGQVCMAEWRRSAGYPSALGWRSEKQRLEGRDTVFSQCLTGFSNNITIGYCANFLTVASASPVRYGKRDMKSPVKGSRPTGENGFLASRAEWMWGCVLGECVTNCWIKFGANAHGPPEETPTDIDDAQTSLLALQ